MDSQKSAINAAIAAVIGLSLFFLLKPVYDRSKSKKAKAAPERRKIEPPVFTDEQLEENPLSHDAMVALNAYIAAWNDDDTLLELAELNDELHKEMSMTVHWSGTQLVVRDSSNGNDILMNETEIEEKKKD